MACRSGAERLRPDRGRPVACQTLRRLRIIENLRPWRRSVPTREHATDPATSTEECEQTLPELERLRVTRPAVRADELSGERAGPRRFRARRLKANFQETRVPEPLTDRRRQVGGPAVARPDYRRVARAEWGSAS